MPRDETAGRVAAYASRIGAPLALGTEVRRLTRRDGGGFRLETAQGTVDASEVVIAIGSFHTPRIPAIAADLPTGLTQLHSHDYRNESSLPPGAVLVVGSGQSGVQIAEELQEAGRRVYLSAGSAGRASRQYRGRDFFRWLAALATRGEEFGVPLPTVDRLPDPRTRQAANPQLSGHHGGHETDLGAFAAAGMTLLGRIRPWMDRASNSRRISPTTWPGPIDSSRSDSRSPSTPTSNEPGSMPRPTTGNR